MTSPPHGELGPGLALRSEHRERDSTLLTGSSSFTRRHQQRKSPSEQSQFAIAWILDQFLLSPSKNSSSSGPLQQLLQSGQAKNIQGALKSLPKDLQTEIQNKIGKGGIEEIVSISQESDSKLFHQSLLTGCERRLAEKNIQAALLVNHLISQRDKEGSGEYILPGVADSVRSRAAENLAVIRGGGSFGRRLEFQASRFVDGATEPSMIVGMAVGSTVFTTVRSMILPRLLASPTGGFLTRGFGARLVASSAAFVPEVGAFWGTSKGINELRHPGTQSWDLKTNWQEIRSLALTLGCLKTTGFVFGRAGQAIAEGQRVGILSPLGQFFVKHSPIALQQTGMLTGIMMGHGAEIALGWRPGQDFGSFFTDSLIFWTQFNIGGALSQRAFPGLYRFSAKLHQQVTLQEQNQLRALQESAPVNRAKDFVRGIEALFSGDDGSGSGLGGLRPALAMASEGRGTREARDFILHMGQTDGPEWPTGTGVGGGKEAPSTEKLGSVEKEDSAPLVYTARNLPERTGKKLDSRGKEVVDRFEDINPDYHFPSDMLIAIWEKSPEAGRAILTHIGWGESEIISLPPTEKLDRIGYKEFGSGLALAMREGMKTFLDRGEEFYKGKRIRDFFPADQLLIHSLDEMVGVFRFSKRAGQVEITNRAEKFLGDEWESRLFLLEQGLREVLGPHIKDGVLGPDKAMVSLTAGAMSSILALLRHRIRPGELTWRYLLYVLTRRPLVADEWNVRGLYPKRMGSQQINYRWDPPIIAVGPDGYPDPIQGHLTQAEILRRVLYQQINFPSRALAENLTPEYIRGLPPEAQLGEVIKGCIGPDYRGAYPPKPGEQRSLLPYELIDLALARFDRQDVVVSSGGGYVPANFLWWGKKVRMGWASREGRRRYSAPGGKNWAEALAGEDLHNAFIKATFSHHQHSTELGGFIKNIISHRAGMLAVELLRSFSREGRVNKGELVSQFETEVRRPLLNLMIEALRNEMVRGRGIRESSLSYTLEVLEDINRCLELDLEAILDLIRTARKEGVPIHDRELLQTWYRETLVPRRLEFAPTRNPFVGMLDGFQLLAMNRWGSTVHPRDLDYGLTMEARRGLHAYVGRNQHPKHPIEARRLPEEVYRLHEIYYGSVVSSPKIPRAVRRALRGEIPEIEVTKLREDALEGASPKSITLLGKEIEGLERLEKSAEVNPEDPLAKPRLERQRQLLPRLVDAMEYGDLQPVRDFPYYTAPYENVFVIPYYPQGSEELHYRAYVRMSGENPEEVHSRLSQFGMFLRSFGESPKLHIEFEVSGLKGREGALASYEIEHTLREILTAHYRVYKSLHDGVSDGFQMTLELNTKKIEPDLSPRTPFEKGVYYNALAPLLLRLRGLEVFGPLDASQIRAPRYRQKHLIDELFKDSLGWPMLLGYFGGPINQGIKASLGRPEKQTLVGIYSGDKLVETFTVYRGMGNRPMVLNQKLMAEFQNEFPQEYKDYNSTDFFEGFELDRFFEDFEQYADNHGMGDLHYRVIDLQSLPIEYALVGRVSGINPAVLREFLKDNSDGNREAREAMLAEINPLYEQPLERYQSELPEILNKYLDPYYENNRDQFEMSRLFRAFRDHGPEKALRLLVFRRFREKDGLNRRGKKR